MIRNLKVLGLALFALMAVGAASASAASAAEFHSDATTENTILTAEATGTHVFTAAGNKIECQKANFTGTQSGHTSPTVTVHGEYGECTVEVFGLFTVEAEVNMGGCAYEFNANGEVAVVNNGSDDCATDPITYDAEAFGVGCEVEVGPQEHLKSITYDGNKTVLSPPSDVTVTPDVTGIKGNATGGACSPEGEFENGEYNSGPTTVRGYEDNNGEEGAQVPIWVS